MMQCMPEINAPCAVGTPLGNAEMHNLSRCVHDNMSGQVLCMICMITAALIIILHTGHNVQLVVGSSRF